MAKSKKSEETVIPVVDLKQLKLLSLPTQKLISDLEKELKSNDLTVFNPLVETMTRIEAFREIKFIEGDKESIDEFKEAKSTIRSFRAATSKAKKDLKAPYLEIGRKLDEIENKFKDSATEVLEFLEAEFKPYLDAEEEKKRLAEEKKNKAILDQIESLSETRNEQQLIIERMTAYNRLSNAIMTFSRQIGDKLQVYSLEALKQLRENIYIDSPFAFTENDIQVLLPEQVEELKANYQYSVHTMQQSLDLKIASFYNNQQTVEAPAQIQEPESVNIPIIAEAKEDSFKVQILDTLTDFLEKISELNPSNENEVAVKTQVTQTLLSISSKIDEFL